MKATIGLMWGLALIVSRYGAGEARAALSYTPSNGGDLLSGFGVSLDGTPENGILVGGTQLTASDPKDALPGYLTFTTVCLDAGGRTTLGVEYVYHQEGFDHQVGLNPIWGNPLGPPGNDVAAYQALNNAAALFAAHQNVSTPTDWAALQLAIWKALYDTTADGSIKLGAGSRFTLQTDPTGVAWNQAQGWLSALNTSQDPAGSILRPNGSAGQEFFAPISPVPEPTTLTAGALLLLPLALSTVRFLRRRTPA